MSCSAERSYAYSNAKRKAEQILFVLPGAVLRQDPNSCMAFFKPLPMESLEHIHRNSQRRRPQMANPGAGPRPRTRREASGQVLKTHLPGACERDALECVKRLSRHKRTPPRFADPLHLFHGPLDTWQRGTSATESWTASYDSTKPWVDSSIVSAGLRWEHENTTSSLVT